MLAAGAAVVALVCAVLVGVFIVDRGGGGGGPSTATPGPTSTSRVAPGPNGADAGDTSPVVTSPDHGGSQPAAADDSELASVFADRPRMKADITQLITREHQAIVARDFATAWGLLTRRKRLQDKRRYGYAGWRKAQASLSDYLDPSSPRVRIIDANQRTGVVTIRVTGMRWTKPGARCSSWSGITWVRYEGATWKYDPGYSTTPDRKRKWKSRLARLLGVGC